MLSDFLGKITDYIVQNPTHPTKLAYKELDVGSSLDDGNRYVDKTFGNDMKYIGSKFPEVI